MTQLLRDPSDISNYVDRLVEGIGLRGSSFRDVDRLTVVHNGGQSARFLFQELKWRSEWDDQTPGQKSSLEWMMKDLARLPGVTACVLIVEDDGGVTVRNYGTQTQRRMSDVAYRDWFQNWWHPKS